MTHCLPLHYRHSFCDLNLGNFLLTLRARDDDHPAPFDVAHPGGGRRMTRRVNDEVAVTVALSAMRTDRVVQLVLRKRKCHLFDFTLASGRPEVDLFSIAIVVCDDGSDNP